MSTSSMPAILAIIDEQLDVVASPAAAARWIRACNNSPALRDRMEDLYIAAQLTLLGNPQYEGLLN